jgi:hypothetical protein
MNTQTKTLRSKGTWEQSLKLASVPLLLAGLGACATPFNADVSRFQSQLPAPTGETFAVVADDPALAGGLEFATYADLVEEQMERLGYTQTTADTASLLVRFDYDVDEGRERIRRSSLGYSGFGGFGFSRFGGGFGRFGGFGHSRFGGFGRSRFYGRSWGYGFYDPWFGAPTVRSVTVFTSGVDMKIDRAGTGERLFEGKAEAVSTSNRLQYLVPNLVDAMFTDFPGNSGETLRISIAPEKKKVRRIE